ncbi:hypothetical protein FRC05_007882 [Tulasnella sp. 425]|nr:hypothetical protein FRC05_007882 [Tulasnella sp. 425]
MVWMFQNISSGGRWDVFWAYAQRVRTVEACNGLYTREVIDHWNHKLQTSSCGPSLLPNLRSLSMTVPNYGPYLFEAFPIIPAGLRTLEVTTERNVGSSAIQRLFKHLTDVPLDQLVDVKFRGGDRIYSASLSLCRATFLQQNRSTLAHLNLSMFPLTHEDLEHIGSFSGVTKLALEQQGTSIQLSKFFGVIGSSFPSLRAIMVMLDRTIREDVSMDVIGGLEPCRELQSIYLASHRWKSLTKQDVRELGHRWPEMEVFSLHQAEYHPDQVATPLGILEDFAQVWSRTLHRMVMLFDTAMPLPGSSSVRFKFDKLEMLSVGRSLLHERDMDDVVEFLKAVSPRQLNIMSFKAPAGSNYDRWGLVKDRVNAAWAT